jgi:integrase
MASPSYLKQRGPREIWHFQRAIPPDVKGKVDPELFKEKSLKTADRRAAEKLVRPFIVKTDAAIDRARALARTPDLVADLTPAERAELASAGGSAALFGEVQQDIKDHRLINTSADLISIVDDDFVAGRLEAQLRRLEGKTERAQLDELAQIIREKSRTLHKLGVVVDEIKTIAGASDPGLYDVVDDWKRTTNQPEQTVRQFTYAVRRFCEVNGDLPVRELTKDHIRTFADRLPELPAYVPRANLDLTFDSIVFLADRNGWDRLSAATIAKHLQGLRVIVKHAVARQFIEKDPFEGFRNVQAKGKKSDAAKAKRKPFTAPQLRHLLDTVTSLHKPSSDDYWVPHIAAYQGARLEEICQLDKADIQPVENVPCIRITDADDEDDGDTGKKVKNKNSVRTVPIHPKLLDMGFLDFVKLANRRSNDPKLFRFEADSRGRYGGAYGKRFGRLLRDKAKIEDSKITFHSTRHSWTDAARNAGVPFEMRAALAGRESEDGEIAPALASSEGDYGEGYSKRVLLEALAKVDPLKGA